MGITVDEERYEKAKEVLARLDAYAAMEHLKRWLESVCMSACIFGTERHAMRPILLEGAPGTGKTAASRLIAEALYAVGIIPTANVVSCNSAELTSPYVGQTYEKAMSIFDGAVGGVLFVDDAHLLCEASAFNMDVLRALITFTEENRGKVAVILAGYEGTAGKLFSLDAGLGARTDVIKLRSLTTEECTSFLCTMLEGRATVTPELEVLATVYFREVCTKKTFANLREVRALADHIAREMQAVQCAE